MKGTALAKKALKLAASVEAECIRIRRDIHQHPEIGFEEVRTTELIAEHLAGLDIEFERVPKCTGLIARLVPPGSAGRRKALALRADIDALPLEEKTGLPFASKVPGKGHLCGHDLHTAMLMSAATALAGERKNLPRPVTFIFQPAEECIPNGAPRMIAAGVLDGVESIFGLHVGTDRAVGVLSAKAGPFMASMDRFDMTVTGKGGHGAMPHVTKDPIVASASVIQALQTIASRQVSPVDPVVVTVGTIEATGAFNIIPGKVKLSGTTRSLSPALHARLPELVRKTAAGAAGAHGCRVRSRYSRGTPVLVNGAASHQRMCRLWRGMVSAGAASKVVESQPTMGGEDFAYYVERVPGCFAFMGAAPRKPGGPLHNSAVVFDERALKLGVALHLSLALEK